MGSPSGIWTSVSGGMAQSQLVDTVANNLANANTVGFKKDTPTFKEYLTTYERAVSPEIDIPRTIYKDSDFYHHDGKEHAFVNVNSMHTDHSQGAVKLTHGPFDMAIDGAGFFTVKTPEGLRFTRAGDFKMNSEGTVVTNDGYPLMVLAQNGLTQGTTEGFNPFTDQGGEKLQEFSMRGINLQSGQVTITANGQIYLGNQNLGTLAVAEFADPRLLQKTNSTLYANPDGTNVPRVASATKVRQGFLELSNVNSISELTNLIKANRMFESNMRAIKTYSEMAGKEANEVGKL